MWTNVKKQGDYLNKIMNQRLIIQTTLVMRKNVREPRFGVNLVVTKDI